MDLGNKVKTRREELGLSQEELAFKMGYKSRTSINKIENGRDVSQKIIVKLAEALQTSPAYLMGWEDEEKEKPTIISERERKIMRATELLQRYSEEALLLALQMLEKISPKEK